MRLSELRRMIMRCELCTRVDFVFTGVDGETCYLSAAFYRVIHHRVRSSYGNRSRDLLPRRVLGKGEMWRFKVGIPDRELDSRSIASQDSRLMSALLFNDRDPSSQQMPRWKWIMQSLNYLPQHQSSEPPPAARHLDPLASLITRRLLVTRPGSVGWCFRLMEGIWRVPEGMARCTCG